MLIKHCPIVKGVASTSLTARNTHSSSQHSSQEETVSVHSSGSYLSLTLIKYCSIAKNVLPQDVMVAPTGTSFQEPMVSAAVSPVGEGTRFIY